ncbi:MAG TPA: aldose epimerase family protein [Verrucomicrobiota bacterium]|nr:aldose epimerase family protein [Verrucomicrobiota bacterium]HPU55825.1 aldose epimerase family protein [Verrucomicrobiota bacterium]
MKTNMIEWMLVLGAGACVVCLVGCATSGSPAGNITKQPFGKTPDGQSVELYTLRNSKGAEAKIITYGGIVQSLTMPDRNGNFEDVVLGFDSIEGYTSDRYLRANPYFGALIGRYGNRIGDAKFTLDGQTYTLAPNNNGNSLHGGNKGFDKVVWNAKPVQTPNGPGLELTYLSKDGEEGFPGNLNVKALYTLTHDNELRVDFTATTDKPTVVNLTQHSYFNLRGQGNGDILGHEVYINADRTTPVDSELIPTGEFASVDGTPFDFRKPTAIGARIDDPNTQLQYGPGYDHNWVINKPYGQLGLQARVYEPTTGRVLEVLSDQPGLQFYAGNFLDGSLIGKGGKPYPRRSGFCMEPQHYPDSPNKPQFPSTTLRPGETYKCTIIYKFSAR